MQLRKRVCVYTNQPRLDYFYGNAARQPGAPLAN